MEVIDPGCGVSGGDGLKGGGEPGEGLGDKVTAYSFRHTMARWLRAEGVPAWEVAAQLGHKQKSVSTTEIYAPFDPAYLKSACGAIDRLFSALNRQLVL